MLETIRIEVELAVAVTASTAGVVAVGTSWVMVAVEVKSIASIVGEGVSAPACAVRVAVGVAVRVGGNAGIRARVGVKPDDVGVNK